MKKLAIIYSLILSTAISMAQNSFDKYEDYDNVSSVIVTDEMFKLLKEIEPESADAKEEIGMLSELTDLKVFSTEDASVGSEMIADANSFIKTHQMKELMRINDKDAKVKFYIIKGAEAHIAKQLIMTLTKTENQKKKTVVMLVSGNVDLRKLSKLNKKVKIINGKYLEKIEEEQNK